jgi:hypothetical protein
MTNLDMSWIAAVLAPRDVAPHPNFGSQNLTGPASRLAALLGPWRLYTFRDILGSEPIDTLEGDAQANSFVEACEQALTIGQVDAGARAVSVHTLSSLTDDLARSAAGALLASVAFSELDQQDQALGLLAEVINTARSQTPTAERQLVLAVLLQQRALRLFEIGETGGDEAREVIQLLERIDLEEISNFPLSPGVSWTSLQTCQSISDALLDSARTHVASLRDALDDGWQDIVRARPAELLLKEARSRSEGYQVYLGQAFEAAVGSTTRHLGGVDRGEFAVYQGLLFLELLGHPHTMARRSELAVLRFMLSAEDHNVELQQEALRLFRQGRDKKRLSAALRRIRSGGPLSALHGDALQVLKRRVEPPRLGDVELTLLTAAAELLSVAEASRALDAVLSCIKIPFLLSDRNWQAESARLEDVWPTAVALAFVAERVDDVAARLFMDVSAGVGKGDELLDRVHARTADALDWGQVSPSTSAMWRKWASGSTADVQRNLLQAINSNLGLPGAPGLQKETGELNLEELANVLNGVINGRGQLEPQRATTAQHLVRDALSSIRRDAARGAFSGGGLSVADIAVGLALYAGGGELWEDITDFLVDPLVQRADKSEALERIAREADQIPESVARALGADLDSLLSIAPRELFGGVSDINPYPSALRSIAALKVIGEDRLLTECARLAGAVDASTRIEAAKTLTTIVRLGPPPWTVVLALQFSRDPDAGVRAEAARCLALLLPQSKEQEVLIGDRLIELLREDGILVPILILRGFAEVKDSVPINRVTRVVIENLAKYHSARGVRIQASAVLSK